MTCLELGRDFVESFWFASIVRDGEVMGDVFACLFSHDDQATWRLEGRTRRQVDGKLTLGTNEVSEDRYVPFAMEARERDTLVDALTKLLEDLAQVGRAQIHATVTLVRSRDGEAILQAVEDGSQEAGFSCRSLERDLPVQKERGA